MNDSYLESANLLHQLRQLRDVGGDAPHLISCQWVRRWSSPWLVLEVSVGQLLPVLLRTMKHASLASSIVHRRREAARQISPVIPGEEEMTTLKHVSFFELPAPPLPPS